MSQRCGFHGSCKTPSPPGSRDCSELLEGNLWASAIPGRLAHPAAVRYREYRKFLAGAFFVSSGVQLYFYLVKIPIPLMWTAAVQSPELSALRGAIHFMLFLICLYFGWFFRPKPHAD